MGGETINDRIWPVSHGNVPAVETLDEARTSARYQSLITEQFSCLPGRQGFFQGRSMIDETRLKLLGRLPKSVSMRRNLVNLTASFWPTFCALLYGFGIFP